MPQQALELILARNLVSTISVAAFLIDDDGNLVFFNDDAARLIGRRFEETGRLTRTEWNEIGPLDGDGNAIDSESLPLTTALREGRPAHGRFRIRTDDDALIEIETSALPLIGPSGFHGAMVVFWPAAHPTLATDAFGGAPGEA